MHTEARAAPRHDTSRGLLSPEHPIPTTSTSITPNRSSPQHPGHSSAENPHRPSNALRKKQNSFGRAYKELPGLALAKHVALVPCTSGTSYLHAKLVPGRAAAALTPASELLRLRPKRSPPDPPCALCLTNHICSSGFGSNIFTSPEPSTPHVRTPP